MRMCAILAAVAAIMTTMPDNAGRKPGQSVTVCDDGGTYAIVATPEECRGTVHAGVVTVVGEGMISIDLGGKNLIIDTVGKGS